MSTLRVPGNIESLKDMEEYVLRELEDLKLSADLIQDIRLVVEEVFSNIVFHGYPETKGHVVVRVFVKDPDMLCIQFEDWGIPFNPLEHEPPNLDVDFAKRKIGGLGIHLVRQLTQEIHYVREDDSNILTVCFRSRGAPRYD